MIRYYLNSDPIGAYEEICNDENYVDKTGLVAYVNSTMKKPRKLTLVSRPRRFGKTYAAMVHLGHLSYDQETGDARIPNREICGKYLNMLKNSTFPAVYRKIAEADGILMDTLKETVDIAYYTVERFYMRMYEVPSSEGYADMVLYPRAGKAMPLMAVSYDADKLEKEHYWKIERMRLPEF